MTQVTIINGSPNLEKSNTSFVLSPFIEGMEKAGANIELIYARKLKIKPCIGCFKCWRETIGECFQEDDMRELLAKFKETDILVIATPVYAPLPGELQNMFNRMVPLVDNLLVFREGRTRAKFHEDVKISKILGIVIGGWWELANLDVVTKVIEELTELFSIELTETIRRPHAYMLQNDTELNKEIMKKLEKVGFDLVRNGNMDQKDLEFIRQPLMKQEEYLKRSNQTYLKRKAEQL